jgi:phenylacetate-CoA ligase
MGFNDIYHKLPHQLQNVFISGYGYFWRNRRLGDHFSNAYKQFEKHKYFNKSDWDTFQTLELRKLLLHAKRNVPYYTELFESIQLKDIDIQNFELSSLKDIPKLSKDTFRRLGKSKLMSKSFDRRGDFLSSSGSTGTPVSIYFSYQFHQKWNALMESRVRNPAGVSIFQSRAMIGGRQIMLSSNTKPPFYRLNFFEKQVYFSAYHLGPQTVANYAKGFEEFNIQWLTGYANSIYQMAILLLEAKIKIRP